MSDRYANRHEFFATVDDTVRRLLAEHGVPAGVSEQVAAAVADGLAEDFAGQEVYVPQDFGYKLCKREAEILAKHMDGVPRHVLMRDYNMTRPGLDRLLKRARTRDPDLGQGKLFGT